MGDIEKVEAFISDIESKLRSSIGEDLNKKFLRTAADSISSLAGVNYVDLLKGVVSQIGANGGVPHRVGERMVPLRIVKDGEKVSSSLSFTGIERSEINSSGFISLVNNVENENEMEVASSRFSMVFVVLSGECRYEEYCVNKEIPEGEILSDVKREFFASKVGSKLAVAGDVIVRNRASNIISFDNNSKSVLLAVISYASESSYQFVFNKNNGSISRIVDFDVKSSRKVKALHFISKCGGDRSISCVSSLLCDRSHNIRWMALKYLIANDKPRIFDYLEKGAADNNAEIAGIFTGIISRLKDSEKDFA